MASFGEELKRERELRDISLKEISEATKISIRFLEALELNNFDVLPGGVFNRGFIRAYARFIGVDGEEMVNAYLHEVALREARQAQPGKNAQRVATSAGGGAEPSPVTRAELRASHRSEIPPETRFSPRVSHEAAEGRASIALWALVVLALLVGVGVITMSLTGSKTVDASAERRAPAIKPDAGRQDPAPPPPVVQSDTPPLQQQATVGELPSASPAPGGAAASPAGGSDPGPLTSPVPETPPIPEHMVRIRVNEITRVILECAGKVSLDQELWPGQSRSLLCTEPVLLSADNGGAVEYSLDNGPVTALGEVGQKIEGLVVAPVEPETPISPAGQNAQEPHAGN